MLSRSRRLNRLRRRLRSAAAHLKAAMDGNRPWPEVVDRGAVYSEHVRHYLHHMRSAYVPPAMMARLEECKECERRCPGVVECLEESTTGKHIPQH